MGMPYRGGQRPVVGQDNDTLVGIDRGDLFTQEGDRPERTAWQWEYEDGQVGSGVWVPLQPFGPYNYKRSPWDEVLPAEGKQRLQIGPECVGRRFRLQTWGGFGPSQDGGNTYVEWGNADGSHVNDLTPSERSYSEPWTVKPFGPTAPPPPPIPTARFTRTKMIESALAWEVGQPGPISLTRIGLARRILELPDAGLRTRLGAVREALDAGEE